MRHLSPLPRRLTSVAALAAATLLAACGSSGESSKTADQILADAKAALKPVTSFHISGTLTGDSNGLSAFDMKVNDKDDPAGTMKIQGTDVEFVFTGGKLYLRGKAFWEHFNPGAASIVGDQWVTAEGNAAFDQASTSISSLTDISGLADSLTSSGPVSKSGTKTVNGESVVALTNSEGELDVADSGPAYPVHLDGGSKGKLDLGEFGSHFDISAPSNPLDAASLGQPTP